MPVDTTHSDYDAMLNAWTKCRTAEKGEDSVKAAKDTYLPLLTGMESTSSAKYKAYLYRAMFYGATSRTVRGLTGTVNRKPMIINMPESLIWKEDVNGTGVSLDLFASQVLFDQILIGWGGLLVDIRKGYKMPYPVYYFAEQVINWKYKDGKLVMVMIAEQVAEQIDQYETKPVDQWRELALIEGVYTVILWRKNEDGEFFVFNQVIPEIRGAVIDSIPFDFVSPNRKIEQPPLKGMIDINFHHYQNSADYEHGLHFTGLPTPYIFGIHLDEGESIEIGSETAIISDDPQAKAGYLEFSGAGLNSLVTAMDNKKQEMAALGARMLQADKKQAETAETAKINKSGDSNTLTTIVGGVESSLNRILSIMAQWQSILSLDVSVEMNRDFVDEGMTPQEITALVGAWQSNGISKETLVYNFQKNDLLQAGRTIEEEISAINSQTPELNAITS